MRHLQISSRIHREKPLGSVTVILAWDGLYLRKKGAAHLMNFGAEVILNECVAPGLRRVPGGLHIKRRQPPAAAFFGFYLVYPRTFTPNSSIFCVRSP
jgi:hypothetical protein